MHFTCSWPWSRHVFVSLLCNINLFFSYVKTLLMVVWAIASEKRHQQHGILTTQILTPSQWCLVMEMMNGNNKNVIILSI